MKIKVDFIMLTLPEFTIKDLVKTPSPGYANFEGESRVFMMFQTVSPKMKKLREGNNFSYKGNVYRIVMRMPPNENRPTSVQFNCLKAGEI